MKKIRFLVLTACILLIAFGLVSCKSGDEETQPEAEYFTVTFNTNGGSEIEPNKIIKGGKITKPTDPEKDGYVFDGWTCNGTDWQFDIDTVTSNITLTAKWINADTVYTTEALENGIKITGVKREFESMVVPSVIGGRPVVAIGDGVFEDTSYENVVKITVAETVTSVGKNAFKNCVGIEMVIKGSLTEIGERAFFDCTGLAKISFGEGLTYVSPQAFSGCTGLTELIFPESLTLIDENAFEDCENVETVIIHGTTKTVSDGAFLNATGLKAIYFYGTEDDLDAIEFANGNEDFTDVAEKNLYFYSASKPTDDGKYWYFNNDGKVRVW